MNGYLEHGIPADAISKGKSYGEVLQEYMRIWNEAKVVATVPGKSEDEIFSDTMAAAAYRLYLLGVEDGMKEVRE